MPPSPEGGKAGGWAGERMPVVNSLLPVEPGRRRPPPVDGLRSPSVRGRRLRRRGAGADKLCEHPARGESVQHDHAGCPVVFQAVSNLRLMAENEEAGFICS